MLTLLSALVAVGLGFATWGIIDLTAKDARFQTWFASFLLGSGFSLILVSIIVMALLIYRNRNKPNSSVPEPPPVVVPVQATPPPQTIVVRTETTGSQDRPVSYWTGRPQSLRDGFLGRQVDIDRVTQAFKTHRTVVISGGAGSGKTRLAAEFTHTLDCDGFWSAAGSDVDQTLVALSQNLNIDVEGRSDDEVSAEVVARLSRLPDQTMWVIDDLGDLDMVNSLVSDAGPVRLLITTRDSNAGLVPNTVAFLPLDVLQEDAAIRLLISRPQGDIPFTDPALPEVARIVGYLPLALEMLAVRLFQPLQNPASILEELKTTDPDQLEAFQESAGATVSRPDGVFATISGTLSQLPSDVREHISGLGYVADRAISFDLFRALSGVEDESGLARVLAECGKQSVLTIVDDRIIAHSLTMSAISATNDENAFSTILWRSGGRLRSINLVASPELRDELPHQERMHREARRRLGPDDPSVLNYGTLLAIGYGAAGRTEDAIRLDEEVLEARVRVLGPEHPDTLTSKSNLAIGYSAAGRTDDAEDLFVEDDSETNSSTS